MLKCSGSSYTGHAGSGPLVEQSEEENSCSGETMVGDLFDLWLPQGYGTSWAES